MVANLLLQSAIKENSDALSLLSLVELSILSWDIFPQTCYLCQVGNFIPPKSACPSFFFPFCAWHHYSSQANFNQNLYPTSQEKAWTLPPPSSWLVVMFPHLPATLEFILSLCTFCLCLKCILIPSLPHSSPTCQLTLRLQPLLTRHPGLPEGLLKGSDDKTWLTWVVTAGGSGCQQQLL